MPRLRYKKMNLEELVILSQKEDYKAIEELIRRVQKEVFATFSYLCNKRENILDLTQEALLRMAKNINSLKNPKAFKPWLNQIVSRLFYDELRKSGRSIETIPLDADFDYNAPIDVPDLKCRPLEKCLSGELEKIIKDEILNLPEHFRIAIVLREFEGLSYEEIAQATNTNVGTVKSRIARARCKLQDGLKNYL